MRSRIIVPLDGTSSAEQVLAYVERLALAGFGRVVLLHVLASAPGGTTLSAEQAVAYLEGVARRLAQAGVECIATRTTEAGRVASAIVDEVHTTDAALVVLATRHEQTSPHSLFGSVADSVVAAAGVPVLLIPSDVGRPWSDQHPPRILVSLDGSAYAEAVLLPVAALARLLGGQLTLVRVVPAVPDTPFWRLDTHRPSVDEQLSIATRYLASLVPGLPSPGGQARVRTVVGDPRTAVLEVAEAEHVDLIAMVTHSRPGLAGFALGSVASATVRHARVPILLVHPATAHS
jgi:nucleotide-binding universal stress UspA family protein